MYFFPERFIIINCLDETIIIWYERLLSLIESDLSFYLLDFKMISEINPILKLKSR